MSKVKYDSELMKLMTLFESVTGAKVKDCISGEKLIFVVEENEMGKAIGKNGANIKRVENMLKKKIKLVEFSSDVLQFVRNMVYPIEVLNVEKEDSTVKIYGRDTTAKAMLIGREHHNINSLNSIVKRYFDIEEIRVV